MNTPEVDVWMKELNGFHIPDIRPTKDSVCASDPEAAQNAAKNGWWTCGHHIRPTDIVQCPNKWDWGTSYDDGPSPYTPLLLEKLKKHNLKTTFFVVGSRVIERPAMLVEEYMRGHEISVHTWSHRPLTTLSTRQIVAELGYTRAAIKSVIGITPTTMRPPRGDIDDRVRAISLAMGLVPIMWTVNDQQGSFDTFDWLIPDNQSNGTYHLQVFTEIVNKKGVEIPTGFVTLQHDLYPTTVGVSVKYTMDVALNHQPKYNMRPIGECNNIPVTDLYFETTTNKTFPYTNHTVNILGSATGSAASSAASFGLLSLASLATLGLLL
jgi:peptidoglycan/xylan/chitin deacetylase (PgdA/CDA1 family)